MVDYRFQDFRAFETSSLGERGGHTPVNETPSLQVHMPLRRSVQALKAELEDEVNLELDSKVLVSATEFPCI